MNDEIALSQRSYLCDLVKGIIPVDYEKLWNATDGMTEKPYKRMLAIAFEAKREKNTDRLKAEIEKLIADRRAA